MKNEANNSRIYLEQEHKAKLLSEVKETVAKSVDIAGEKVHTFSAADLWNIQKQKKSTNIRRFSSWN